MPLSKKGGLPTIRGERAQRRSNGPCPHRRHFTSFKACRGLNKSTVFLGIGQRWLPFVEFCDDVFLTLGGLASLKSFSMKGARLGAGVIARTLGKRVNGPHKLGVLRLPHRRT